MTKKLLYIITLMFMFFTPALVYPVAKLKVTGIPSVKGNIMIGVYESQEEFKKKIDLKSYKLPVENKQMIQVLDEMKPGWYMIAIYHDANSNAVMDRLFFGPPIEAYGFSNNAHGFMGPASFKDARFYYDGKDLELEINLGGL